MLGLGRLGVEREAELLVPVEGVAGAAQGVVVVARAGTVSRHVGGVGGDLVRDDAGAHVVGVGEAEVLGGRDVAEHRGAVPTGQRRADGRGDVIVARRDVGGERPQHVEGRLEAGLLLDAHVHLDLVHRDVAGAFDHHLHVVLPCLLRQVTQHSQLGELRLVGRVGEAAGSQRVAQAEADVVLLENFAKLVEMREPRVFAAGGHHPLRHDCPAAADDAGDSVLRQRKEVAQHARVDGHVVHTLLRLLLDDVEQVLRREALDALDALDRLVDGHRAERDGAGAQEHVADVGNVAAGGEIHDGIGAVLEAAAQLFQLALDVADDLAVADVRVDLALRRDADAHRLQLGMIDVGGDDHAAPRHLVADQFGGKVLAARDVRHLLGDDALLGKMHLRDVLQTASLFHPGCPHGVLRGGLDLSDAPQ